MSDIKQAIQELREAVERGDGWRNVSQLYSNLRSVITKRDQVEIAYRELCRVLPANRLDLGFNVEATLTALTALESSIEGGTVDLTARIEAAAEEIAKGVKEQYGIFTDERDVSDITAIIKRHLEVKP